MLDKKEVKKIADLARIELKEEEIESIREDMEEILDYVDQIKKVDTSEVDLRAADFSRINKIRKDSVSDTHEKVKEKMITMGKSKDDYFQVESI